MSCKTYHSIEDQTNVYSSFIVQIGGGLLSLSKKATTAKHGLHIVTAGVVFQEVLIIYFFCLTMRLISKLKHVLPHNTTYRRVRLQVHAVQFSLLLITVSWQRHTELPDH